MKYKRIPINDLKDLEKEFVEFLVLNGIVAEEWERIKQHSPPKAEKIIDQFSDVIWESILQNSEMVEFRTQKTLTVLWISKQKVITLVLKSENADLDLTLEENIDKAIASASEKNIHLRQETLEKDKNEQLFEWLQLGFFLTKNQKYKKLMEKHRTI